MRLIERFESQIDKKNNNECWLWIGEIADHGGGILRIGGQILSAYRLSYEIYTGEITNDLCVCHSCDIRACVNPNHLWLGTHAENMADAAKKNRMHPGEQSAQSKLKNEQVIEIINLYKTGSYSQQQLGKMFGVEHTQIHQIITGKSWKHLDIDRSFRKGRGSSGDKNGTRLHPETVKRGEDHPSTKLSDAIIAQIRSLNDQLTQRELAKQFNISQSQIGRILRKEMRDMSHNTYQIVGKKNTGYIISIDILNKIDSTVKSEILGLQSLAIEGLNSQFWFYREPLEEDKNSFTITYSINDPQQTQTDINNKFSKAKDIIARQILRKSANII